MKSLILFSILFALPFLSMAQKDTVQTGERFGYPVNKKGQFLIRHTDTAKDVKDADIIARAKYVLFAEKKAYEKDYQGKWYKEEGLQFEDGNSLVWTLKFVVIGKSLPIMCNVEVVAQNGIYSYRINDIQGPPPMYFNGLSDFQRKKVAERIKEFEVKLNTIIKQGYKVIL